MDNHACPTFGESGELFDLTAVLVRDGLGAGLKVMWLDDAGQAVTGLSRRGIKVESAMDGEQMTAAGWDRRMRRRLGAADLPLVRSARHPDHWRLPGRKTADDAGRLSYRDPAVPALGRRRVRPARLQRLASRQDRP